MMRIDIISAVPDMMKSPLNTSIIKKAQDKGLVEIIIHDLHDYTKDRHKTIDDKPFGGGPGMLLKPEPFFECIEHLQSERNYQYVIFTSPKGKIYNQRLANKFSLADNILIIAGHYKGIDDRVRTAFMTDEISIGNYILSGGELPALIIVDSIVRLVPGVLGDAQSALDDSFMDGNVIEPPYYTRPAEFKGMKVPDVLLSGDEKKINKWKESKSKKLTRIWKNLNSLE